MIIWLVPSTLPEVIRCLACATMPSMCDSTSLVNPGEVPVSRSPADLHYLLHRIAHALLLPVAVGPAEHLIYDVAGSQQLVLGYEVLVPLAASALLGGLLLSEEGASP